MSARKFKSNHTILDRLNLKEKRELNAPMSEAQREPV